MVNVIGVRFRRAGKLYYFGPGTLEIRKGDHVIVETARGVEIGEVVLGCHEVEEIKVVQPLREVIRLADETDLQHEAENGERQKEAFRICKEKIREHALEMKLIDCEYTFDNSKILFYFTADGRIDFRELVKDLAGIFRTRIELRQVGVRDETKLLGGIGICGRPLCCHSYLSDFIPVSIKMAKEQNLSLNPTKISGVCGRLMCCLKNEEDVYEELNRSLPSAGDYVTTPDDLRGEVHSVSILKQLVKVIVTLPNDEKEIREYPAAELQFRARRGRGRKNEAKPEAMSADEKALAVLEHLEEREQQKEGEKNGRNGRGERPERRERGSVQRRQERIREKGPKAEKEEPLQRTEKAEAVPERDEQARSERRSRERVRTDRPFRREERQQAAEKPQLPGERKERGKGRRPKPETESAERVQSGERPPEKPERSEHRERPQRHFERRDRRERRPRPEQKED